MRSLVLVAVLITACAPVDLDHATLPYAVDRARTVDRPLVVELYATWCKPCRIFEAKVLPDPRVQAALADVVFVRYDVDTPRGKDAWARTRLRRRGIPAVLGIDHDGQIRLAKFGTEPTADQFLEFMRQAHAVLGTHADPDAAPIETP